METAHSFRVYLKTYMQGIKTKNNPKANVVPKPDVLNVWVAKTFPAWQSCILTALKQHLEVIVGFFKHILRFCFRKMVKYPIIRVYPWNLGRNQNLKST